MALLQKSALGTSANSYAPRAPLLGRRGIEEFSLDSLLRNAATVAYEATARECLGAHFTNAAARIGYDYDVKEIAAQDSLAAGLIQLTSRNFGYDFALVQVNDGRGFFGFPRKCVRIYFSNCNANEYGYLTSARSLPKALSIIDLMYKKAAEAHLA